jgi:putative ABC transport system permease protein
MAVWSDGQQSAQATFRYLPRISKKGFTVVANKSFLELVDQITIIISLMLVAIASISVLVSGIGIMNIMLVSVNEHIQEICQLYQL